MSDRMVVLKIISDDKNIWFGTTRTHMGDIPHTRHCLELISDEMYNALMELSSDEKHIETVCALLYNVLCQKGLSNN